MMEQKIRSVVVDDEPVARQSLVLALQDLGTVEIVEECENGFEAVKAIKTLQPDLVFLDIQMPKLSGFDVIELLGEEMPAVIFVTAYDEFAVRAFEANAVDYLLKPVNPERLSAAMEKMKQRFATGGASKHPSIPREAIPGGQNDRLLIRDGTHVHVISYREISHIQAQGDYVLIRAGGKEYLKTDTMDRMQQILPEKSFRRVHRSHIINLSFLKKIEPYSRDDKLAILKDGKQIPISRSGYRELKKEF